MVAGAGIFGTDIAAAAEQLVKRGYAECKKCSIPVEYLQRGVTLFQKHILIPTPIGIDHVKKQIWYRKVYKVLKEIREWIPLLGKLK